jgi:hypothetical protein
MNDAMAAAFRSAGFWPGILFSSHGIESVKKPTFSRKGAKAQS